MYQESKNKEFERKIMLKELPQIVNHNPFGSIKSYEIILIEPCYTASKDTWKRFMEFKWRCMFFGFWYTRRSLNIEHNKNFQKLYGNFYERKPLSQKDLNRMYQEGIEHFFNPQVSSRVDDKRSAETNKSVQQVYPLGSDRLDTWSLYE